MAEPVPRRRVEPCLVVRFAHTALAALVCGVSLAFVGCAVDPKFSAISDLSDTAPGSETPPGNDSPSKQASAEAEAKGNEPRPLQPLAAENQDGSAVTATTASRAIPARELSAAKAVAASVSRAIEEDRGGQKFSSDRFERILRPGEPAPLAAPPTGYLHRPVDAIDMAVDATMALDEVLRFALGNHPLLRARQHEVEVAQAARITAGVLPNPQLVVDADSPIQEHGPSEFTTRLTFTVPTYGKFRLAQQAAAAGIETARQKQSVEAETILAETLEAALEVMYLQEFSVLQEELSKLAAQGARVQKENPTVPPKDVLFTEVNAAEVELDRLTTATDLKTARLRLSKAMGHSTPRLLRIDGRLNVEPLPPVPMEKIMETVRQVRPEIAEAQAAIEEGNRKLAFEVANARPDIELGPRFQSRTDTSDRMGTRFSMDLPVFDRNHGPIAESSAELRVSQAMLRVAEVNSVSDVAAAYVELAPLAAELEYYDKTVAPLARETEKTIREAFELGVIDSHKMVNEMERLGKIQLQFLQTRYRYNRIRGRLELLLGQSLSQLWENMQGDPFVDDPAPAADAPRR